MIAVGAKRTLLKKMDQRIIPLEEERNLCLHAPREEQDDDLAIFVSGFQVHNQEQIGDAPLDNTLRAQACLWEDRVKKLLQKLEASAFIWSSNVPTSRVSIPLESTSLLKKALEVLQNRSIDEVAWWLNSFLIDFGNSLTILRNDSDSTLSSLTSFHSYLYVAHQILCTFGSVLYTTMGDDFLPVVETFHHYLEIDCVNATYNSSNHKSRDDFHLLKRQLYYFLLENRQPDTNKQFFLG